MLFFVKFTSFIVFIFMFFLADFSVFNIKYLLCSNFLINQTFSSLFWRYINQILTSFLLPYIGFQIRSFKKRYDIKVRFNTGLLRSGKIRVEFAFFLVSQWNARETQGTFYHRIIEVGRIDIKKGQEELLWNIIFRMHFINLI